MQQSGGHVDLCLSSINISLTKVDLHLLTRVCVCSEWQVVKQCCGTDGVEANYIKTEILPPFFKHFWQHRMALDRRNYRQASRLSRSSLDHKTHCSSRVCVCVLF